MYYCIKHEDEYLEGGFDTPEDAEFALHEKYNHTVCTVEKENRFYGFDFNSGELFYIGEFEEFADASDAVEEIGKDCGWVFDDQNLSELRKSLEIAVKDDKGDYAKYKESLKVKG